MILQMKNFKSTQLIPKLNWPYQRSTLGGKLWLPMHSKKLLLNFKLTSTCLESKAYTICV